MLRDLTTWLGNVSHLGHSRGLSTARVFLQRSNSAGLNSPRRPGSETHEKRVASAQSAAFGRSGLRVTVPKPPRYPSSLLGYAKAWDKEVSWLGKGRLTEVVGDAVELRRALQLRHDLVHGDKGTTGASYAKMQAERLMRATRAVSDFARVNHVDLEKPLRKRLKCRQIASTARRA